MFQLEGFVLHWGLHFARFMLIRVLIPEQIGGA
jgi:hypothetical protein